jgi:hypothetical protein
MSTNRNKKQKKKRARSAAAMHNLNRSRKLQSNSFSQLNADKLFERLYKDENGVPMAVDVFPFPCSECSSIERISFMKSAIEDKDFLDKIKLRFDEGSDSDDYELTECLNCGNNSIVLGGGASFDEPLTN